MSALPIVSAAGIALLLAGGISYEHLGRARDHQWFPQIGRSVDIGGRSLNLSCLGNGRPTVILASGSSWPLLRNPRQIYEKGLPRPGYSWIAVQKELAHVTQTCWFDPAGIGWSDPGPFPRDSDAKARDLHALLKTASVPPPYVLVAETSSAADARVFTASYSSEVKSVMLIDPADPDLVPNLQGGGKLRSLPAFVRHAQDDSARLGEQVGLFRLQMAARPPDPAPPGLTAQEWTTIVHLSREPGVLSALMEEVASWNGSLAEAREAGGFGGHPLLILRSAGPENAGATEELQSRLAHLSSRGRILDDPETGPLQYRAPAPSLQR